MTERRSAEKESLVMEGVPYVSREDSGCALILEVNGTDQCFVRIQSYDESHEPKHPVLEPLIGRKLRVTITPMD